MLTYRIEDVYTRNLERRCSKPINIHKWLQKKEQRIERLKAKAAKAERLRALINENLRKRGVVKVGIKQ